MKLSEPISTEEIKVQPPRRIPSWDKATESEKEMYTQKLNEKLVRLQDIKSFSLCSDVLCENETHNSDSDSLLLDILFSVIEASYEAIPLTGCVNSQNKRRRNIIPGWTREVEQYRLQSNAAYKLWIQAGKPRNGDLFSEKQMPHSQFRHAVRRIKRSKNLQEARSLHEAAMLGDVSLMREMKRITSGKNPLEEYM